MDDPQDSDSRLRTILETVPIGIYECDTEGLILAVNSAAARLTGYAKRELLHTHIWDRLEAGPPRDALPAYLTQLAAEQPAPVPYFARAVTKPGGVIDIQVDWSYQRDERGQVSGFVVAVSDITAQKQAAAALRKTQQELEQRVQERTADLRASHAQLQREIEKRLETQQVLLQREQSLRRSEGRFRNYFEQGLIGMAVTGLDKRWLEVNDRLCQILGYRREELLGKPWTELTHADDMAENVEQFARLLAGQIEHFTLDKRFLRKDQSMVYTTIHIRAFRRDDGSIDHVVALIEDISQRKQAQEALQREHQTLRHLLQSSDHERQLIAFEIHDGLAQHLAGAIMQFQIYDHLRRTQPEQAARAFGAGTTMLQQSHSEARRLISGVRPPILDEAGIVTAIAHLVNEQRRHQGIQIEFHSRVELDRLAPVLENAVFRIVQEGLSNACRHSQSKKVAVALLQQGDRLHIEIRDWGLGFDPQRVQDTCFGLEGIRQRARLLDGQVTLETAPGQGTRIAVELPVVLRDSGERA